MGWLTETRALLRRNKTPREHLAREAGVGLPWLIKFEREERKNPGILNVEKLHKYLKGAKNAR